MHGAAPELQWIDEAKPNPRLLLGGRQHSAHGRLMPERECLQQRRQRTHVRRQRRGRQDRLEHLVVAQAHEHACRARARLQDRGRSDRHSHRSCRGPRRRRPSACAGPAAGTPSPQGPVFRNPDPFFSASSRDEPYGKVVEAATFSPTDVNRQNATVSSCHQQRTNRLPPRAVTASSDSSSDARILGRAVRSATARSGAV